MLNSTILQTKRNDYCMKALLKIIAVIGIAVAVAKLVEIAIDVLYNNYGKKYITTQVEN